MTRWRCLLAIVLCGLIAVPLLVPLVETARRASLADFQSSGGFLLHLIGNSLLLVAGTLAGALPVGTLAAVLLFRTDLPGRRLWIAAAVLFLFVPLPVLLSGWMGLLGSDGWAPLPGWEINLNRDFGRGLGPAIWVHVLAGLPWVILIVGNGLCVVERELEEEGLLFVGPWQVLWKITLPRCRASLLAAAGWLGLTTFGEISVTYFLQITTFAEEIQTQFSSGSSQALTRSVLLSLPVVFVMSGLLLVTVPHLERLLPPLQTWMAPPRVFALGRARWLWAALVALLAGPLLLLPILGLVWKVGLAGSPRTWSLVQAGARLAAESHVASKTIFTTYLVAATTALGVALLGLLSCWLARDSRWFRGLVLGLMALAWSWPGPVIGVGLKETIFVLTDVLAELNLTHVVAVVDALLYRGPSPAPVMWAHAIRFFPVAVALFWPLVRAVPKELLEEARLAGARPLQELTVVIWPLAWRGFGWSLLVLTALCLGEVSTSNLVETPGWETFAKIVLDRMHYRVDSTVAALCLLQLGCLSAVIALRVMIASRTVKIRMFSRHDAKSSRGA